MRTMTGEGLGLGSESPPQGDREAAVGRQTDLGWVPAGIGVKHRLILFLRQWPWELR